VGKIGFSVVFKNEELARNTLKDLEGRDFGVNEVKLFIRKNQSDRTFLNCLKPKIAKYALTNGIYGAVIGTIVFLLIWVAMSSLFGSMPIWQIMLLGTINGASTGMFLGAAISVINKEIAVPISLKDIENEAVVLDFNVSGDVREQVESLLKESGADHILGD
jgi:hypothetical protein